MFSPSRPNKASTGERAGRPASARQRHDQLACPLLAVFRSGDRHDRNRLGSGYRARHVARPCSGLRAPVEESASESRIGRLPQLLAWHTDPGTASHRLLLSANGRDFDPARTGGDHCSHSQHGGLPSRNLPRRAAGHTARTDRGSSHAGHRHPLDPGQNSSPTDFQTDAAGDPEIVIIIKNSSLVSVIAATELTRVSQQVASNSFRPLESFILAGLAYLAISLTVSGIGLLIEVRLSARGGASL